MKKDIKYCKDLRIVEPKEIYHIKSNKKVKKITFDNTQPTFFKMHVYLENQLGYDEYAVDGRHWYEGCRSCFGYL